MDEQEYQKMYVILEKEANALKLKFKVISDEPFGFTIVAAYGKGAFMCSTMPNELTSSVLKLSASKLDDGEGELVVKRRV